MIHRKSNQLERKLNIKCKIISSIQNGAGTTKVGRIELISSYSHICYSAVTVANSDNEVMQLNVNFEINGQNRNMRMLNYRG